MRRWRYLMPRLLMLAACILFLLAGFEPIVHWAVERSGQSLLHQQFSVGKVVTSVKEAKMLLTDVCVSDPSNPERVLFTADELQLVFDGPALRRQRVVVERGQLTGLRIGAKQLTKSQARPTPERLERSSTKTPQWFASLQDQLAPLDVAKLPSSVLMTRLTGEWEAERERLNQQATDVRNRVEELRLDLEDAGDNPLRNLGSYQEAIAHLDTLRNELHAVKSHADRLGQQLAMDEEALLQSGSRDRELIADLPTRLTTLDARSLNEFLVAPAFQRQVDAIMQWIHWGRGAIPIPAGKASILGGTGRNVAFRGLDREPHLLVKTLTITGEGEFGGQTMTLEGVAHNLTNEHELLGQPTELTVQTIDGPTMLVQATFHGQGANRRDDFTIDCPQLVQPARMLGEPEHFSLTVASSVAHVWARIQVRGSQVDGDFLFKQPTARVTASLQHAIEDPAIAHLVADAASDMDRWVARVKISGSLDRPEIVAESNLGDEISVAVEAALRSELRRRRLEQLASAEAATQEAWGQLASELRDVQETTLALYEQGNDDISRVIEYIATRVESADGVVDENEPVRETFRR